MFSLVYLLVHVNCQIQQNGLPSRVQLFNNLDKTDELSILTYSRTVSWQQESHILKWRTLHWTAFETSWLVLPVMTGKKMEISMQVKSSVNIGPYIQSLNRRLASICIWYFLHKFLSLAVDYFNFAPAHLLAVSTSNPWIRHYIVSKNSSQVFL